VYEEELNKAASPLSFNPSMAGFRVNLWNRSDIQCDRP